MIASDLNQINTYDKPTLKKKKIIKNRTRRVFKRLSSLSIPYPDKWFSEWCLKISSSSTASLGSLSQTLSIHTAHFSQGLIYLSPAAI